MKTAQSFNSSEAHPERKKLRRRLGDFSLLAINAVAAIIFTGLGGSLVYANTQHLIETRRWLEQSHGVLTKINVESRHLDRIEHDLQVYQIAGDLSMLEDAASTLGVMQVDSLSLEGVIRDNPSQVRHAQQLQSGLQDLARLLKASGSSRTIPEQAIRQCRAVLDLLQAEEQDLLNQRLGESRISGHRSLRVGATYLGFSLSIVASLFAFLVRDELRRRRAQQELSRTNARLGAMIEDLERRGSEARRLKDARDELELCIAVNDAETCAARHLQALLPGSKGAVILIGNSRRVLEVGAAWNGPGLTEDFEVEACCGLRTGRARWRKAGKSEVHCTHFSSIPPEDYLCAPLIAYGETLGFIFLSFPNAEVSLVADQRAHSIFDIVELVSIAIARLKLRSKLESESIRDGLTNLFNRQFMEIALDRELHMASRRRTSLAVLMLDVDHFKTFNDTYGHEAGDEILRRVAECFSQSVRMEDVICRYGGEEFVILLPEMNETHAVERAEEIRRNVSRLPTDFRGSTSREINVSIGVAMYPSPAKDAADLLRMADAALYQAKRAGRNQTKVAREITAVSADQP